MSAEHTPAEEPSREAWARAYARQAQSDWEPYDQLTGQVTGQGALRCHQVHYLQMASEKIAKAYRFRDTATSPKHLLRSHVGFTKFFNAFLKSSRVKQMYEDKHAQLAQITKRCRALAFAGFGQASDQNRMPSCAWTVWAARASSRREMGSPSALVPWRTAFQAPKGNIAPYWTWKKIGSSASW